MMSTCRPCPGAVLLLPLLDLHLSQLFQTADSVRTGSHAAATRSSVHTEGLGIEDFIGSAGFTAEDLGLASLRLLYLLVVHSDEVNKHYPSSGCVAGNKNSPTFIKLYPTFSIWEKLPQFTFINI